MLLLPYLKTAFVTLFVAVDPPGLAAIFLALTATMTGEERRITARHAVTIAFCILVAVALGGAFVLQLLGITMPAFRIAGGLLLFYIGAEMVFERREQRKSGSAEAAIARANPHHIAAFPLAIPLMAGPGAITATILQADATHGHLLLYVILLSCIFVVVGSCLAVFLLAERIDRMLGTRVASYCRACSGCCSPRWRSRPSATASSPSTAREALREGGIFPSLRGASRRSNPGFARGTDWIAASAPPPRNDVQLFVQCSILRRSSSGSKGLAR